MYIYAAAVFALITACLSSDNVCFIHITFPPLYISLKVSLSINCGLSPIQEGHSPIKEGFALFHQSRHLSSFHPHSGLQRDFRPKSGPISVTLSVGSPLCPYGLPTVGSQILSLRGHSKSLKNPLCPYGLPTVGSQTLSLVGHSKSLQNPLCGHFFFFSYHFFVNDRSQPGTRMSRFSKPYTPNPKPQTLSPTPHTRNPKP